MVTVNSIEFGTKEEAAQACKAFAAAHPGTVFHNYAHDKDVRTADNRTTLYSWKKLFTDAAILKTHPELKGLWQERKIEGGQA
jgi:hypothetical protein